MHRQPAPSSAKPLPLARARPDIKFEWTTFGEASRELLPLLQQHWRETFSHPDVELDPDWTRVFALEDRGTMALLVARDGDTVAGYVPVSLVGHMMSRKFMVGVIDTYFVHPAYRGTWLIMKLLRQAVERLEESGADVVSVRDPEHNMGAVMRRLGFDTPERTWLKRIDK